MRIFALVGILTGISLTAAVCLADTGTTSGNSTASLAGIDCTSTNLTAPANASSDAVAAYSQAAVRCADAIANQASLAKLAPYIQALNSLQNVQGGKGQITNPGAADHIGTWLQSLALYDAAQQVGQAIASVSGRVSLITDTVDAADFVNEQVALIEMNQFKETLSEAVGLASQPPKAITQGYDNKFLAPALMLVPAGINAVVGLASLTKNDASLSPIAGTLDPTVIVGGIQAGLQAKHSNLSIYLGQYASATDNAFIEAYQETQAEASQARLLLSSVTAELAKVDNKFTADYKNKQAALNKAISAWEGFVSSLNTVPTGKSMSTFQTFSQLAAKFGRGVDGRLLVIPTEIGASGGVITHWYRNGELTYRTTVQLLYLLLGSDGKVLAGGQVVQPRTATMSVDDAGRVLSNVATAEPPSPPIGPITLSTENNQVAGGAGGKSTGPVSIVPVSIIPSH
ncbi:hypothetical protein [Paraburkholderia nodosa]|uniref:hypothetical protein n=1 Tax=Paraburkholderia nodosa TaxID=392320 RepID=UPI0004B2F4AF|nr:hypothetical protein [Paraburkholderia nodosa]